MATVQNYLLLTILLLSLMKYSQALSEMASDENSADVEEERRNYDLENLRRYLLTSKAEERAAKREKQDFLKRELVNKPFPKKPCRFISLNLDPRISSSQS